jgi:SAM-dependent methyltransferase
VNKLDTLEADRSVERFHGPEAADSVELLMHAHRYEIAAAWAAGRRVLDFGTGDGYGARRLADVADSVVGIDRDEKTIAQARLKYPHARLQFTVGDLTHLEQMKPGSFDLLSCFEMLEHVDAAEQRRFISAFARVLGDGGVLVASTPNAEVKTRHYQRFPDWRNPFHVRELDRQQLVELLSGHFRYVELRPQVVEIASLIDLSSSERLPVPAEAAWVNLVFASQQPLKWPQASPAMLPRKMELFEEHLLADRQKGVEISRLGGEIDRIHREIAELRTSSAEERARLLGELDRITGELMASIRRQNQLANELEVLRHAYWLIEQSLGHRVSLLFDRFPRAKQAIISLGNAILK